MAVNEELPIELSNNLIVLAPTAPNNYHLTPALCPVPSCTLSPAARASANCDKVAKSVDEPVYEPVYKPNTVAA